MRMTLAFDTILYFFVTFNDLMKSLRDISRERVKTTFLQFRIPAQYESSAVNLYWSCGIMSVWYN